MQSIQITKFVVLSLIVGAVSGCSLFDLPPPKPDSTGAVRVSCSMTTGSGSDSMASCDQRAAEACDGPALLLDSSFGAPQTDPKTGFPVAGSLQHGVARYQCTPR
jgi:hypothetical protein